MMWHSFLLEFCDFFSVVLFCILLALFFYPCRPCSSFCCSPCHQTAVLFSTHAQKHRPAFPRSSEFEGSP